MEKLEDSINFNNEMIITSYDPKKVWTISKDNKKFFCKQSNLKELETNLFLSENIKSENLKILGEKYSLYIPEIYERGIDTNVLVMEYCDGTNLEFILRDKESYEYGKNILNELLTFLISNKLYWIDFAPRNVILNDNKINLVDFEKGMGYYGNEIEYLRNHVYEEYGSFSFLKDRMYSPDEVFDIKTTDSSKVHYIADIGPKRIKAIAKLLGINKKLSHKEYLQIIKMFIIAEEPEIINGSYYFPRVELEQILKDKNINPIAFDNYAKVVYDINMRKNNEFIRKYKR